jgi:hypothetical protein
MSDLVRRSELLETYADPCDRARGHPLDAARAAEQLADAQDHAARLEAAAIERALDDLARDDQARELLAETRSTGEALRDITGQ